MKKLALITALMVGSASARPSAVVRIPTLWEDIDGVFSQMMEAGHQRFDELAKGISGNLKIGENLEKNMYRIEVALPGFKKEDVTVEVARGSEGKPSVATIKATAKEEKKKEDKKEHSWYFATQSSESSFTLPAYVDPDSVEATMDNGVLLITFKANKKAEEKQEAIKVKIN